MDTTISPIYTNTPEAVLAFRRQAAEWKPEITIRITQAALRPVMQEYQVSPEMAFRWLFISGTPNLPWGDMLWHYGISSEAGSGMDREDFSDPALGDCCSLTYRTPVSPEQIAQLDSEIHGILKELHASELTPLETVLAVARWITENVSVGKGASHNLAQTAYSAVVERQAVCAGYSLAFCRFMELAGIRARYIAGPAQEGGEIHGWNLVELDGRWYNLDLTWDRKEFRAERHGRYYWLLQDEETFTRFGFRYPQGSPDADRRCHIRLSFFNSPLFHQMHPMAASSFFPSGTAGCGFRTDLFHSLTLHLQGSRLVASWSAVCGASQYSCEFYVPGTDTWYPQKFMTALSRSTPGPSGELRGLRVRTDTGVVSETLFGTPEEGKDCVLEYLYPSVPWITFSQSPAEGCVSLRWTAEPDAAKYLLYQAGEDGIYRLVQEIVAPVHSASLQGLASGTRCSFKVVSQNSKGVFTRLEHAVSVQVLVL